MLLLAGGGSGAGAQQLPSPGGSLAIDLLVTPPRTMAGGQVRLSGKTASFGASSKVTLRVQPPGGAPVVITAVVGKNGAYAASFGKTSQLGSYGVQAIAPDQKGQAKGTFVVVAADVIPLEVGRALDSLVAVGGQAVQAVKQGLQTLPKSAERAEAEKRLAALEPKLAQLPPQAAVLKQQMQKVFKARAAVPEDNAQWDAYVGELDGWRTGAAQRGSQLRSRIAKASAGTQKCGRLDAYNEMLTMAAELFDFATLPFDMGATFWTDKVPPAFVARAGTVSDPATKLVAVQAMKLGAGVLGGAQGLYTAVPGLIIDLSAYLVQQEFAKYCQKFEGPLSARFVGESFTTDGEPFLDYTIQLDGKLVLMYDRSAPANQPIGVLGYLEGSGRFKVRDNPEPIVKRVPGAVLFHDVISPPGGSYVDEIGQANRSLLPHSFHIPVKGTLAGDSIVLALLPATHDFGALIEGRTVYVVMPPAGLVPEIWQTRFPLQKAFPILERTIRRHPVLRVTAAGAQGTFARDTTNAAKTARVRTEITIKACNPGCLPLPLTPGKK